MPLGFMLMFMAKLGNDIVHNVMSNPKVEELMNSGEKFDVCIVEVFEEEALLVSDSKSKQFQKYLNFSYRV